MPAFEGNRRRRVARKIAVVLAVSLVLGIVVWLTRPPALVWWTSPRIGNTGHRFRVLVPFEWEQVDQRFVAATMGADRYYFRPADRMPKVLRWIFPYHPEDAQLSIHVVPFSWVPDPDAGGTTVTRYDDDRKQIHTARRYVTFRDAGMWLNIYYYRPNQRAFDATYETICNSPRIE